MHIHKRTYLFKICTFILRLSSFQFTHLRILPSRPTFCFFCSRSLSRSLSLSLSLSQKSLQTLGCVKGRICTDLLLLNHLSILFLGLPFFYPFFVSIFCSKLCFSFGSFPIKLIVYICTQTRFSFSDHISSFFCS
jgi:hypothetical protein